MRLLSRRDRLMAILADLSAALQSYLSDDALVLPMATHLVVARP